MFVTIRNENLLLIGHLLSIILIETNERKEWDRKQKPQKHNMKEAEIGIDKDSNINYVLHYTINTKGFIRISIVTSLINLPLSPTLDLNSINQKKFLFFFLKNQTNKKLFHLCLFLGLLFLMIWIIDFFSFFIFLDCFFYYFRFLVCNLG